MGRSDLFHFVVVAVRADAIQFLIGSSFERYIVVRIDTDHTHGRIVFQVLAIDWMIVESEKKAMWVISG